MVGTDFKKPAARRHAVGVAANRRAVRELYAKKVHRGGGLRLAGVSFSATYHALVQG